MPEEQYLTVRQFAAEAGVSPQSIYKAVDNRLSTYCKRENGVISISADALTLYGCQPVVNQLSTEKTPQETFKRGLQRVRVQTTTTATIRPRTPPNR